MATSRWYHSPMAKYISKPDSTMQGSWINADQILAFSVSIGARSNPTVTTLQMVGGTEIVLEGNLSAELLKLAGQTPE